ncbi:MAG: polysaccharide deacetylase family protein [bacterium]
MFRQDSPVASVAPRCANPIPILMYHGVEDTPLPANHKHLYVMASEFARHMNSLKRAGYQAITLDDVVASQKDASILPEKPIVLTFDDGYANLYRNVHPILGELGYPYTVYLVSGKIGQTSDWDLAEGYVARPLLKWREIHRMHRDGHAHFHPHSITHPRMAQLSPQEAYREMSESRDVLAQEFGVAPNHFCYPFGSYSDVTRDIAAELGFVSAVTTEFGRVRPTDDPLRLPRISMYHVPYLSFTYGIAPLNFWWRIQSREDRRDRRSLRR